MAGSNGSVSRRDHVVLKGGTTLSMCVSVKESGFYKTIANDAVLGTATCFNEGDNIDRVSKINTSGEKRHVLDTVEPAVPPVLDKVRPTIG